MPKAMLRIRRKENKRYELLIDEQFYIGWDNILRGKFSKQWKIQQQAYLTRIRLRNPAQHARDIRNKKREEEKNNDKKTGKKKNKTEAFHMFFQSIVPFIKEIWKDRCIDRNTPVIGGRIVAEYDTLSKKVTQLYTLKEMVLPEDETKVFNETLEERLEDTNQQLKKWLLRWRPVVDHSMKRVKELAQENSKPIWRHFTADKPAKIKISRKAPTRRHEFPKRMSNNPLTNVFERLSKKRSSSRTLPTTITNHMQNNLILNMFKSIGKKRSTSRIQPIQEVEEQTIADRYGDAPS